VSNPLIPLKIKPLQKKRKSPTCNHCHHSVSDPNFLVQKPNKKSHQCPQKCSDWETCPSRHKSHPEFLQKIVAEREAVRERKKKEKDLLKEQKEQKKKKTKEEKQKKKKTAEKQKQEEKSKRDSMVFGELESWRKNVEQLNIPRNFNVPPDMLDQLVQTTMISIQNTKSEEKKAIHF